jgi:hypothetical protein
LRALGRVTVIECVGPVRSGAQHSVGMLKAWLRAENGAWGMGLGLGLGKDSHAASSGDAP